VLGDRIDLVPGKVKLNKLVFADKQCHITLLERLYLLLLLRLFLLYFSGLLFIPMLDFLL
jgi:hypothetical protein